MKECVTVQTENSTLPPNKRVNYAYGMVMDVDAFRQEQTHFEWKHALGNRLLHGYGTVCGLQVHAEADGPDVKILVEPGYAVNPRGQWIWVEEQLCARLNAWVQNNWDDNDAFLTPGANQVFVSLCYEECPTDLVPIAGRACATEEDTRSPSRILESLRAEFAWERPEQMAEDAARVLGEIMGAVVLSDDSLQDESDYFLSLVANLGEASSPPFSPPLGSPPGSPPEAGEIRLWRETVCETIQRALVIWATEVCPRLERTEEKCVLLACIDFDVDAGGRVLPATVTISDCDRPVLVPARLQQELFCLLGQETSGVTSHSALGNLDADDHPQYFNQARGDARYALLTHTHDLDELDDVNAPGPGDGQVLTWNAAASEWQPRNQPPTPHAHDLDELDDVNAATPGDGEVLTWNATANEWQPGSQPPAPHAHALDELDDVDAPAPAGDDMLAFNDATNRWQAQPTPFVAHPAPAGPYAIVAAGWFAANGDPQARSYNDLRARALTAPRGDYVLDFNDYVNPEEGENLYIVKGTVQDAASSELPRATFEFVRFQDNGIRVRVLQVNGEPLNENQGFMVEISAYGGEG